jgi:HK97 family phage major capsid protein
MPAAFDVFAKAGDDDDPIAEWSDEQIEQSIAQHERLVQIRSQANAGGDRSERDERRLQEAEETLAVLMAERDQRNQTPADIAARTAAAQPRARTQPGGGAVAAVDLPLAQRRSSMPASPRSAGAGSGGFRDEREFLGAVMASSRKGGTVDPRLISNAPTTYGQEGVGADGGFAVPPDFRANIIEKVMGETSLLSRTDQWITTSNAVTVPVDETTPWQSSGGIQAYWESEGGQKTQSKPALKGVQVKANKIICLVPLTDELLEDAPSMFNYVNRKAPVKIDFKINDAIINGSGVGQPLGILQSAGTVTVEAESGQAPDTVTYGNVVDMWGRLAADARSRAVWLANSDIESGQLMRMSFPGTGTAVPVYLPPGGLAGAPYGTLLGRPVITSEAMPALGDAGDLVLADMSQYMSVVKNGGLKQDVSIHVWFDYDITAFRFVLRVGGQPWWNSPIERLGGQAAKSYFVKLGARA